MPQNHGPSYELLMLPFEADFDFLEDVGRDAMAAYKDVIQSFKIMPKIDLPKNVVSVKGDAETETFPQMVTLFFKNAAEDILKHYNAGEKVVGISDMIKKIPNYAVHNKPTIHLMIIPYYLYGDEIIQNGTSIPNVGFSIMSTYGLDDKDAKVKTALREVGDVVAGKSS